MLKRLSKEFQNMLKFWLVDQKSHKGADKLDGSSQNPTCNSIIISHPNIYYYYISFSYDQPTVVSQVGGLGQIVALLSSLKALNETNFQTKIKTIKLHLLDMNPYTLPGMLGSLTLLLTSIWSSCRLRPARSLHWMEPNLLLLKSHLCLPSLKRKALPSSSYTSPPEDPLTLPSPASLPPLDPVFCLLDPVFCLLDPVFCLLDPILYSFVFCLLDPIFCRNLDGF